MTYQELIKDAVTRLESSGIEDAVYDAYLLLEHMFGITRSGFILSADREVLDEGLAKFEELIARRQTREPLAYITGKAYFMGLEFDVENGILVPRSDTETLAEIALDYISDGDTIVDVCTGSGCIAISLAVLSADAGKCVHAIGLDISETAVRVASANAKRLGGDGAMVGASVTGAGAEANSVAPRIEIVHSDTFSGIDNRDELVGAVSLIVSNPPYIRSAEIDDLMPEVSQFEPRLALDGDEDGLIFYRRISEEALKFLKSEGVIIYEIGFDEADAVYQILDGLGYVDIEVIKDYSGNDRVVKARRC